MDRSCPSHPRPWSLRVLAFRVSPVFYRDGPWRWTIGTTAAKGAAEKNPHLTIMKSLIAFCLVAGVVHAGENPQFSAPKEIAPGVFMVGTVRMDKNARTVTIPAKVNMVDGLVEYLCVSPKGAIHESVIVSDAGPKNVHMAMLLLGAKGAAVGDAKQAPGQITAEYIAALPKLTGDRVMLSVKWKDKDGKEKTAPAERWVQRRDPVKDDPAKGVPMSDGPWIYTGSFVFDGRFVADGEGAFVAIATMPSALINNPRTGAGDDKMWFANTGAMPPIGTPVEFIIKLENAKETQK